MNHTNYLTILIIIMIPVYGYGQTPLAWINEFHYDNAGTDQGEFVEIVVRGPQYEWAQYSLVLYNGSTGSSYDSLPGLWQASSCDTAGGERYFLYTFPVNGIQNGAPDGMVLFYNDSNGITHCLDSLSYEGSLPVSTGPLAGTTLPDIMVSESNTTTQAGYSLQRSIDDPLGLWDQPALSTPGHPNKGVLLPVTLLEFHAEATATGISLRWSTASEIHSSHFIIGASPDGNHFNTLATVQAAGNSNLQRDYEWSGRMPGPGLWYFRLRCVDADGSESYSSLTSAFIPPSGILSFIDGRVVIHADESFSYNLFDSGVRLIGCGSAEGELNIPTALLPAGIYVLHLGIGGQNSVYRFAVL